MLDWEGKLSLSLFVGGCNFRCPFCHNPELVLSYKELPSVPWEDIEKHLLQRKDWLDGIVIGGGEPTLQPKLLEYLERFKEMGFPVKIDTNGSRPDVLEEIVKNGLASYIAMDIKASLRNYQKLAGTSVSVKDISISMEIIKGSGLEHEFRTTVVPGFIDRKEIMEIARFLKGGARYVLQQFNPKITLDKQLGNTKPYSVSLLQEWAKEASKFIPTKVRGG